MNLLKTTKKNNPKIKLNSSDDQRTVNPAATHSSVIQWTFYKRSQKKSNFYQNRLQMSCKRLKVKVSKQNVYRRAQLGAHRCPVRA